MDQLLRQLKWKNIAIIGVIATVTPGGYIALGIYGISKFLKWRKSGHVQAERSEERSVSNP